MATTNTSRFGGMETAESLLGNLLHMLDIQLFREVPVPFLGEVPLVKLIILGCTFAFINIIGRLAKNPQHKKEKIKYEENVAREESKNPALTQKVSDPKMTISQLYIYPIKSLRGCSLPSATLTEEGFSHDRKFMLLRVHDQDSKWGPYQNMHVAHFPQMALFHTSIQGPNLHVTYHGPGSSQSPDSERPTLEIELTPSTFSHLQKLTVNMHSSATTAYNMGPKHNDWFSQHFGFPVILAHTGNNRRLVLGNLPHSPPTQSSKLPTPATKLLQYIPFTGSSHPASAEPEKIAFNDCAPYLIITTTSCQNVAQRLPPTTPLDITKFRANIIISGSPSAFDEDYWRDLEFPSSPSPKSSRPPQIHLTANCGRCISLNIDHETGTTSPPNKGILKLLMHDRRVDPGVKYSPVFGRYGFLRRGDAGTVLRVGDTVAVPARNGERTTFGKWFPAPPPPPRERAHRVGAAGPGTGVGVDVHRAGLTECVRLYVVKSGRASRLERRYRRHGHAAKYTLRVWKIRRLTFARFAVEDVDRSYSINPKVENARWKSGAEQSRAE